MPSEATSLVVMLIKVSQTVRAHPSLRTWIDEIDADYMRQFGALGMSLAHIAFENAPWDFGLVFPGTSASIAYLTDAINAKAPGQVEFLTMTGTDLDSFQPTAARKA